MFEVISWLLGVVGILGALASIAFVIWLAYAFIRGK